MQWFTTLTDWASGVGRAIAANKVPLTLLGAAVVVVTYPFLIRPHMPWTQPPARGPATAVVSPAPTGLYLPSPAKAQERCLPEPTKTVVRTIYVSRNEEKSTEVLGFRLPTLSLATRQPHPIGGARWQHDWQKDNQ